MHTVHKYIDQGVSNSWKRGFESYSKHAKMRISKIFCVVAVLCMSFKELISYTKSLNVTSNEENPQKRGGPLTHMDTQRHKTRKVMNARLFLCKLIIV